VRVLIYHTAPWCTPCKKLKPKAKKIAAEMGAEFREVNIDERMPVIPQILGVPTVAIFEEGSGEPLVVLGPQQATPANIRKWLS